MINYLSNYFIKNKLSKKLILWTILFSSFITLVITAIQLYQNYEKSVSGIDHSFELIRKSRVQAIAHSVWVFDEVQLETQLEGLLALPDFEAIRIYIGEDLRWAKGEQISSTVKSATLILHHRSENQDIELGRLELIASIDNIYDRIIDQIISILVGNGIKTFLVAGFLLILFRFLVAKRLENIARFAGNLNFDKHDALPQIALATRDKRANWDEIDQVSSALNDATSRLNQSFRDLSESEERYRDLIEGSVLGVVIHREFTPLFVNRAFAEIHGYEDADAVLSVSSLLELVAPHEHDRMRRYKVDRKRGETVPAVIEYEGVRKDGSQIWLESRSALITWQGEAATQSTIVDIGERKRAEQSTRENAERVRATLENVADAVVTIDEKGLIESFNPSAERLFGYSEGEIIGHNVKCLMPEDEKRQHDGFIENYVQTGARKVIGFPPRQVRGRRKDNSTMILELAVSESWIGDRRTFIGALRDISGRIEMEAQSRQFQKMQAVGQLTGGIAHDFNNLLTIMFGNLEMLQDKAGEDKQAQKLIDAVLKAAQRGADLTHRLLAFSRNQPLKPEITDINRMIPDTAELLRRTLGEEIEIESVLAGGLWKALVDRGQLQNAILNLAINARDAMPTGGKLTIETANAHLDAEYTEQHDEVAPGQYVMIAVSDTGGGMPPEILERAFDPFFTTKEVGKGTGLGLSMVYGFAKQSQGHAAIYSETDHGSTVKIYLLKASGGAADDVDQPMRAALQQGWETVLVVEDDEAVREFLVSALATAGYQTLVAAEGETACGQLTSNEIDILVTDVVLPGSMTGRDIADQARAIQPGIAVLYISGYARDAIIHQGKLDEGVELLMKPFTRDTIIRRVRELLDSDEA